MIELKLIESPQNKRDDRRAGTASFTHSGPVFATGTNVNGVRSFSEDSAIVRPGVTNLELIESQQRERDNRRAGTACLITRTILKGVRVFPECGAIGRTFAEAAYD